MTLFALCTTDTKTYVGLFGFILLLRILSASKYFVRKISLWASFAPLLLRSDNPTTEQMPWPVKVSFKASPIGWGNKEGSGLASTTKAKGLSKKFWLSTTYVECGRAVERSVSKLCLL